MHNKTDLMPHTYFRYGSTCLKHFEKIEKHSKFKLMNTYATRLDNNTEKVLIYAKDLQDMNQHNIECLYTNKKLTSLNKNNNPIELDEALYLEN